MDIRFQTRGLRLINRVFSSNKQVEPVVPFSPQKPEFQFGGDTGTALPRVTPESVGVSSDTVNSFLKELSQEQTVNLHGILLSRNGKVFCDLDLGLYRGDVWHTTYSMCKSVVSLAIGMLFDEGRLSLDERVTDILETGPINRLTKNGITVKDLLVMSSGVSFNELGAVTETQWKKCFFESVNKFDSGSKFEYNSMNTYMLSRIIKKKTGVGVNEYLEPRLWNPLGISLHPWELSPEGTEKGGWGLYLRREDAAKLGILVLNNGLWQGRRIISEKYLSLAVKSHFNVPVEYGGFNYGHHIWSGRNYESFLFNGMFGQNVVGIPANGIVVAANGGNDEVFQNSRFFDLVEKYFGALTPSEQPENPKAYKRLRATCSQLYAEKRTNKQGFFGRIKRDKLINEVVGTYRLTTQNAKSAGLLPVVLRVVQNNYPKGMKEVSLRKEGDSLLIDFQCGDGIRRITAGLKEAVYTTVDFGGEKYLTGALARVGKNEDGITVITVNCAFCETASQRVMKIFFLPNGKITLTFTETPGEALFERAAEMIIALNSGKILSSLAGKADVEYLRYRIRSTFNPVYQGEKIK